MDAKPTPLNPIGTTISNNYVIILDKLQYLFYQSDHIDICAPDGGRLQTVVVK